MEAWIGLGSNLGDRTAWLHWALDALARLPHTRCIARSGLWQSPAFEAEGPDYLNAVARLDTQLDPYTLLAGLQALERFAGRTRPYPNAPRTLDLDLLLNGQTVIKTPTLTLPHPRLHQRAFVLRPLAQINRDLLIPGIGTVQEALAAVADQACEPWPAQEN